jgi:hypothetical protein
MDAFFICYITSQYQRHQAPFNFYFRFIARVKLTVFIMPKANYTVIR